MSGYDDNTDYNGGDSSGGSGVRQNNSSFGYSDDANGGTVYDGSRTTHTSWFGRAKNKCTGVVIGIALFTGSFVLLGWNELRAVNTANALRECGSNVQEAECDNVHQGREGQVVHVSCAFVA